MPVQRWCRKALPVSKCGVVECRVYPGVAVSRDVMGRHRGNALPRSGDRDQPPNMDDGYLGIIGRRTSTLHQSRHPEPLHILSRENAASYLPFDAAVDIHQDARE